MLFSSVHRTRIATAMLPMLFLLASCAGRNEIPNRPFEGTIVQTIHAGGFLKHLADSSGASSGGMGGIVSSMLSNMTIKLFVRQDKLAYDMEIAGGLGHIRSIIDRNTRMMTMIMGHNAIVTNLKAIDTLRTALSDSLKTHPGLQDSFERMKDSLANSLPKPTGKHQTINGFETEEYRGSMRGMDIDMWVTDDPRMKFYTVFRDAMLGKGAAGTGGLDEFFDMLAPVSSKVPIKSTISLNGKELLTSELSSIEEEKLDDAIFQIPAGTQVDSLGNLLKGMHHADTTNTEKL